MSTLQSLHPRGTGMAVQDIEHPARTRRSGYRYLFTAKHHGGDKRATMWLKEIDRNTEFSIFDVADFLEVADGRGWLFGVLPNDDGDLREVGTGEEKVAEFQPGREG